MFSTTETLRKYGDRPLGKVILARVRGKRSPRSAGVSPALSAMHSAWGARIPRTRPGTFGERVLPLN